MRALNRLEYSWHRARGSYLQTSAFADTGGHWEAIRSSCSACAHAANTTGLGGRGQESVVHANSYVSEGYFRCNGEVGPDHGPVDQADRKSTSRKIHVYTTSTFSRGCGQALPVKICLPLAVSARSVGASI